MFSWLSLLVFFGFCATPAFGNPNVPEWFQNKIGTIDFPFGLELHSLRCEWAGIFPDTRSWVDFTDDGFPVGREISYLDDIKSARMRSALVFFEELGRVNPFFSNSGASKYANDSIQLSGKAVKDVVAAIDIRAKDQYESIAERLLRVKEEYFAATKDFTPLSYVAGSFHSTGIEMIPVTRLTGIEYDPDLGRFSVAPYLLSLRQTRNGGLPFFSDQQEVYGFSISNSISLLRLDISQLDLNAVGNVARELHPFLVVVVTGQVVPKAKPGLSELASLGPEDTVPVLPTRVEVRNACTNETLTYMAF